MRKLGVYTVIACAAFLAAFSTRVRQANDSATRVPLFPADAPDSVRLVALGIRPGAQLVAYVFGGSRCGFCQNPETKRALASLRQVLTTRHIGSGAYKAVSVVGVAANTDLREGLGYLESIGADAFNEISVGSGWQNEHIIRLIRRERIAEPGLPLVIVVSRPMTATLAPLTLTYGADSVVKVVQGSRSIVQWVRGGADLAALTFTSAGSKRLSPAQEVLDARAAHVPTTTRR
ncbi:MAG: hypothetical protein WKG32_10335 [Gemmatimonadaceae bacterium]